MRFDDYNISASKSGFPTVSAASGHGQLQCRLRRQAASYRQRLCGLWYVVQAGRRRNRRHFGQLWRPNPTSPINQIFGPTAGQGGRSRDQVGVVRPSPARDRSVVPYRREQCARTRSGRISQCRHHRGRRRLLRSGHRHRGRRQDHRQVEHVRRPRADDSRVTQSSVPADVGDRLANVAHQSFNLLAKYEVHGPGSRRRRRSIARRSTAARCSPRTRARCCRIIGASTHSSNTNSTRTDDGNSSSTTSSTRLYYDAFYQSAAPFVLIAPGRVIGGMITARF